MAVVVDGFMVGKLWLVAPYAVMVGISPELHTLMLDIDIDKKSQY